MTNKSLIAANIVNFWFYGRACLYNMIVLFEKKFLKQIESIENKELKLRIRDVIIEFENASDIKQIKNVKKLSGHKSAYRYRIGEYRLGVFYEKRKAIFTCFMHRKDIYKYFP